MTGLLRCLDCAAVLYIDPATGELVDSWSERICTASYRAHVADLPLIEIPRPAAGTRPPTADHATGEGPGLTGADCPTSRALRKLRVAARPPAAALDTGHPATPVAGPSAGRPRTAQPAATRPHNPPTEGIHR